MAHQPTPEQLDRLSHARVREAQASAGLADAQYKHTLAMNELASAISDVLYGPLSPPRHDATADHPRQAATSSPDPGPTCDAETLPSAPQESPQWTTQCPPANAQGR